MAQLPADAQIGEVTLGVSNLERSLAFYTDIIGLTLATAPLALTDVLAEPGADRPWQELESGTAMGHVHLHVPDLPIAEVCDCDRVGFTPMLRDDTTGVVVSLRPTG